MTSWNVTVDNASFDGAGITKDCQDAICEFVQNGFEANATIVDVHINETNMQQPIDIIITDNGTGVHYDDLKESFGGFLSSGKRHKELKLRSQQNKGKGRFSYTALSHMAEWDTVYCDNGIQKKYSITLDAGNKARVNNSLPAEVPQSQTCGTVLRIPVSDGKIISQLSYQCIEKKLLERFAWYLYLNRSKRVTLRYMGQDLDYSAYVNSEVSNELSVVIDDIRFCIDVVVWKNHIDNTSRIYYLGENGEVCESENSSFNRNTVDFYHSVFVRSSFFANVPVLLNAEDASFIEYQPGQKKVMRELKRKVRILLDHTLQNFLLSRADKFLQESETQDLYPRFSDDEFGRARKKDFMNVTKELYCVEPRVFYKIDPKSAKALLGFLALLLDSNERKNVLDVVEQLVALTTEQRVRFAQILHSTKLEYAIDMIDIIQKRYRVVRELQEIVYDKNISRFANERDHIQQIIENHYWLFGDQYQMVTADVTISKSLEEFSHLLDEANVESLLTESELRQRMDVMLYAGRLTELGEKEGLIIELKAPTVKLSPVVFAQIERYANIIRRESRFSGQGRRCKFYAICSDIDDDIKAKYPGYSTYGKPGLAGISGNFEIYALTWDDIFLSFENRYRFLLEKMQKAFDEPVNQSENECSSRDMVNAKVKSILG